MRNERPTQENRPNQEPSRPGKPQLPELDAWLRGACALIVAGVAAYASYVHQRTFALQGGADPISASLWPLSVDGLLLLATAALLRQTRTGTQRAHHLVWLSFLLGIGVSLAANIAAAPTLAWKPVLVAGWPRSRYCSRWSSWHTDRRTRRDRRSPAGRRPSRKAPSVRKTRCSSRPAKWMQGTGSRNGVQPLPRPCARSYGSGLRGRGS